MMDIIERAARAMCEHHIRDVRRHDTELPRLEEMLPEAVDYAWRDFTPQSLTVLRAIRVPSVEMVGAAMDAGFGPDVATRAYQSMIDGALDEGQ